MDLTGLHVISYSDYEQQLDINVQMKQLKSSHSPRIVSVAGSGGASSTYGLYRPACQLLQHF